MRKDKKGKTKKQCYNWQQKKETRTIECQLTKYEKKGRKKEMSALNSISSDNILKNLEDRKTFKKIIKTQRTYH